MFLGTISPNIICNIAAIAIAAIQEAVSDAPLGAPKFSKSDQRFSWLYGRRLETISKQKKILESLTDLKIESLATNFVFSFPFVDKVIFGIRTVKHLNNLLENIKNFKKVNPLLIKKIIDLNTKDNLFCKNTYRYNN